LNSTKNSNIHVRIGTRGSELALWQARFTQSLLENHGISSSLTIIKTKGDLTHHLSFDKIEGKGFFTKEIEDALLAGEVDLAVHSCKDMPTADTEGLLLSAYSARVNPADILLIHPSAYDTSQLLSLRPNAVVATSSSRRKNQILALRPDMSITDIRGNVPTRIQKLRDGIADATVLAAAGLERLQCDISGLYAVPLAAPMCIPAPAQGILAYQIRKGDDAMMAVSRLLDDAHSRQIIAIERQLLHAFGGGCQVPIGIYAQQDGHGVHTWISYAKAASDMPLRRHYYFSDNETPNIAAIVSDITTPHKEKSVFISRTIHSDEYLYRILHSNGYSIQGQSCIDFAPVHFDTSEIAEGDILFFSSKNGFHYFESSLEDKSFLHRCRLAAINTGTALYIRSRGYLTAFEGKDSHTEKIGEDLMRFYAATASSSRIWFLGARHSLRSIQHHIPEAIVGDIVVYENRPSTHIAKSNADIMVFTSPMNVRAYTALYTFEAYQKLIAIGGSTAATLESFAPQYNVAFAPTPWSLADSIMSVS